MRRMRSSKSTAFWEYLARWKGTRTSWAIFRTFRLTFLAMSPSSPPPGDVICCASWTLSREMALRTVMGRMSLAFPPKEVPSGALSTMFFSFRTSFRRRSWSA